MKVSVNSWHYRLWNWGRDPQYNAKPRDLCRYFWHIALVKILLPVAAAVVLIALAVFLVVVMWQNPWDTLVFIGIVAGTTTLFLAVLWHEKRQKARRAERLGLPPREPGLVRQYVEARKRKVCPLIEVVDKEENR